MKFACLLATSVLALFVFSTAAKAEVIYGFNDPTLNGFTTIYDQDATSTVSESTSTGVTEGSGALHINVGATGGGYDQIDVATTTVPADLIAPANASLSVDAAANYANAGYITVAPEFYLNGTTNGTTAFGTKFLFPNKTLAYDNGVTTDHTYTFTLMIKDPYATAHAAGSAVTGPAATPADGDSTTALYTVGHILNQVLVAFQAANPNATAAISSFGLEETTNTDGTDPDMPDDLYLDNVTIPSTPEPASFGLLAIGGTLLARRNRANGINKK